MLKRVLQYAKWNSWIVLVLEVLALFALVLIVVAIEHLSGLASRVIYLVADLGTRIWWIYWDYAGWVVNETRPKGRKSDGADGLLTAFAMFAPIVLALAAVFVLYLIARLIFRYLRAVAMIVVIKYRFGILPYSGKSSDLQVHQNKVYKNALLAAVKNLDDLFTEQTVIRTKLQSPKEQADGSTLARHIELEKKIAARKAEFYRLYTPLKYLRTLKRFAYIELLDGIEGYRTKRVVYG